SSGGVAGATTAYNGLGLGNGLGALKNLDLIGGVAVTIPSTKVNKLAKTDGLIVTPDAVAHTSAVSSNQLWPYESGNAANWAKDATLPAIAIVDSGVQSRNDFGGRLIAS